MHCFIFIKAEYCLMKRAILLSSIFLAFIISLPICFADEISLTYDQNGNLVTREKYYKVYKSLNQLWKVYNESDTSGNHY